VYSRSTTASFVCQPAVSRRMASLCVSAGANCSGRFVVCRLSAAIMTNTIAVGIRVVAVANADEVEYWAVATPREAAASTVQQLLAPGWKVALTERRVLREQVAALNLRPGDVCKLKQPPRLLRPRATPRGF
jgi:hypothetical protein